MAQPSCHYDKLKQCPLLTDISTSVFTIWTSSKSHLSCPGSVLTGHPQLQAAEHSMKKFKWLQLDVPHQKSQGWVVQRLANSATQSQAFAEIRLAFLPLQQDGSSNRLYCTQLREEESWLPTKALFHLGEKKIGFPAALSCCRGWIGLPDPYWAITNKGNWITMVVLGQLGFSPGLAGAHSPRTLRGKARFCQRQWSRETEWLQRVSAAHPGQSL